MLMRGVHMQKARSILGHSKSRAGHLFLFVSATLTLLGPSAKGQSVGGGQLNASGVALVDSLGKEVLDFEGVQRRAASDIAHDLDAAQQASTAAEQDRAAAIQLVNVMKARVEVVKQTIDVTKAQLDLAKKEKREADATRLDGVRKREELQMSFLDRLAQLEQALADQAAARKDLSDSRIAALKLENDLEARRVALRSLAPGDKVSPTMEKPVMELEGHALEAISEVASREQDVSGKDKDITERRIAVFEVTKQYRELLQQPQR
jgi:hypothetical protein